MRRRWRWGLGCLTLVLAVFAYRVFSIYEFRAGECLEKAAATTIAPTYPPRLLVMSYNIQGHAALVRPNHIEKIAEAINQVRPDIIGINEAHRRTWQSRFRDHVEELRTRTGMNAAFGESYEQLGGQFGNAILTRGQIVKTEVFKLPGAGEPRTLLKALIRIDGGMVVFYVTHLAAWEKINRGTRSNQLECLVRYLGATPYPFVLAGDINAPPDSPEVVNFLRETSLQMCGPVEPTHRIMNIPIDYIFADRGWQVRSARSLDIGPSDHRPVLAELVHDSKR